MTETAISYNSLFIIVLLAAIVPVIIQKIKIIPIPIVVGEIIAGIIVGKSGLNLIESSTWLEFLYTFGFAFLMFLSGLEIDFKTIRSSSKKSKNNLFKNPLFIATFIFISTLFLSFMIVYALKFYGFISDIILMTLILSATSLGIVVPILKERNILHSNYGQIILLTALIADFATMILMTLFVSLYASQESYQILLFLLLFVAFFIFYKTGLKIINNKFFNELYEKSTFQLGVRGAFALILIFMTLSEGAGAEIILGAFLAGMILSLLNDKHSSNLYQKMDAIGYGFFIPIFFVMVGANFDFRIILENPKALFLVPALLISVYFVNILPSLLIMGRSFPFKKSLAAGILISPRLSLAIAAGAIGLKLGIISEAVNGAIILMAIITCTFSPLIFNQLVDPQSSTFKKVVYMIGINPKTILLGKRMHLSGNEIVYISSTKDHIDKTIQKNERVIFGNLTDPNWLETTGIASADAVVISMPSEEENIKIIRTCKEYFDLENVIVFSKSLTESPSSELYGARAITSDFANVLMAENYIDHPNTFNLLFNESADFYLREVQLINPNYFGKPLSRIDLPGDCLILSIMRNSEKIIPHGYTELHQRDFLMLAGSKENVQKAEYMLGHLPY